MLELGCGPGEHARALAEAGFQVVAVDRSPDMLAQATQEPTPPNLRFVEGDIIRVDQLVEGSFGGGLCLGNTLPHLETDEELGSFAAALARTLEPGAPLLVQVLNYDRIHDQGLRVLPVNVRPHEEGELIFLRLMTPLPDGRVRFSPSTLLLRPGTDPPLFVERSREVLLRGWRRGELEAALSGAGIASEKALGDFAGAPFDPEASQDLILVARRL